MAQDKLLIEVQMMCSQVTILSLADEQRAANGWLEGTSGWDKEASSQVGGVSYQFDGTSDRARSKKRRSEGSSDQTGSTDSWPGRS